MSSNKRNRSPPRTPRQRGITTPTSSSPNYNYLSRNNPLGLNISIQTSLKITHKNTSNLP